MFVNEKGEALQEETRDSIPIMVTVDDRGIVEAAMCFKKGGSDGYTVKVLAKYLDNLGVRRVMVQRYGENAVQSLVKAAAKQAPIAITTRTTPR